MQPQLIEAGRFAMGRRHEWKGGKVWTCWNPMIRRASNVWCSRWCGFQFGALVAAGPTHPRSAFSLKDLLRRWWQMHRSHGWLRLPAMPKAYELPCGATIIIEMDLGW